MTVYIRNNNNEFRIENNEINIRDFHTQSIIMGGIYNDSEYNTNITIKTNSDNKKIGYITHIKYEPECSLNSVLERGGGMVEMVKLAIQYVSKIYPEITTFELQDTSNIECDKIDMTITFPPRKIIKPLSLSSLYILLYGKTWYELHFNARMINNELYNIYKREIHKLGLPINKPLTDIQKYVCDNDKYEKLRQYYDANKSWHEFFNKIPKNRRCELLYNWIPEFVSDKIYNLHMSNKWVIDVDNMEKTYMQIIDKPTQNPKRGGGKAKNKIIIRNDLQHCNF